MRPLFVFGSCFWPAKQADINLSLTRLCTRHSRADLGFPSSKPLCYTSLTSVPCCRFSDLILQVNVPYLVPELVMDPIMVTSLNTTPHNAIPLKNGWNRRSIVQVGFSSFLSMGLGSMAQAASNGPRAKSVILVFQTGAPSHIDTFDPKPDSPLEVRGEFGVVKTSLPGVVYSEHLPMLAARAHRTTIVRSFSHKDNNHTAATHHIITGSLQPGVRFDKPLSRDDWPCYGAAVSYFSPASPGIPTAVTLPTFLADGPLVWPGQHGGFLGPRHDPWQITKDPSRPNFKAENLTLPAGLSVTHMRDRMELLTHINASQDQLLQLTEGQRLSQQQQKAAQVLGSGAVARAFDLAQEPEKTRERYGRHAFGQSLLLARRLAQAGVKVIQANMGRVQNWDSHENNFKRLKNDLLPPLDKGVSALLDDLAESGMDKEVLVVVMGEFGRSPKVDQKVAGRDHWAPCFSGLVFGAGVRQGQVLGQSDKTGAYPATPGYSPDDMGATIYHALGIDHESELRDRQNRPTQLNRGQVMSKLFG